MLGGITAAEEYTSVSMCETTLKQKFSGGRNLFLSLISLS